MRVARSLVLLALTAICCAGARAGAEPPTITERKTAHYDVYLDGGNASDADAIADLAERQYDVLAQFFGRAPDERLVLRVFSSQERYAAVIKALSLPDAESPLDRTSGSCGVYNPADKAAYAAEPCGPYCTRENILHECVHQFHFLATCSNAAPKSQYYVEGLAEHFAVHQWDGSSAALGRVPKIAARDDPGQALIDLRTRNAGGSCDGYAAAAPRYREPSLWRGMGLSELPDRTPPRTVLSMGR
jgi:hypothetical protein